MVALPEGFTINPSVGAGLGVCTPAQYAAETATSTPRRGLPQQLQHRRIHGRKPALVESTSFEQLIEGSIYLAEPYKDHTHPRCRNPFDTLIAFYLVAKAPENGILVKVAGELVPNPQTGQLVAVFEGLPQLPYTNLKIHFREGQRAPLATPAACGTLRDQVELTPWLSTAQTPLHQNFRIPDLPAG